MMIGTTLNALGIVVGGMVGVMMGRQLSSSTQVAIRGILGIITIFIGLRITWASVTGGAISPLKQLAIVVLALMIGRLTGSLLHIQKGLNHVGKHASAVFAAAHPDDPNRLYHGFMVCTLLFCAGPLGPVGSVLAGLAGDWQPLAIKMVLDGLAAMGFAAIFGPGVMLSALPVFVFQGMITILVQQSGPFLLEHRLVDSTVAVGGLLIFCVSLIMLELK